MGTTSSPWGTPTSARPGTGFGAFFIEEKLFGISKRVPLKFKIYCTENGSNPLEIIMRVYQYN